jgi:hypothetical protein
MSGAALLISTPLFAAELVDNDQYTMRLDTNIGYTLSARTAKPAKSILANPNTNDGDGAFKRGDITSNRMDISMEFDAALKDKARTGVRMSVNGWYDDVYNGTHERIPAESYNADSVDTNEFTRTARRMAGRDVELFDLFFHSALDLGDHTLSYRVGRHTVLWGESLLLASNGIASGQAPINAIKAQSVPLTPAKEVFMPVNQVSMAFDLSENLSVEGYYQLEYRETKVSPPGTFFSTADMVFQGADRIIAAPGSYFYRGSDVRPRNSKGQWGVALKYRDFDSGWDYGLYYLRYSAKTPFIYSKPGASEIADSLGTFNFIYPRNIEMFGTSATTTMGDINFGGEVSYRRNMPLTSLVSALVVVPGTEADGDDHPLYAVGETVHAQVSAIWAIPTIGLWDSASLAGEIGGHHLVRVTENAEARDTSTGRTMMGLATTFEPKYYQMLPGADVSFPVSLAYNFSDKASPIDPSFNGGTGGHGGSVGIGTKVQYNNAWRGSLNWTKYIGSSGTNNYGDRDFVALNVNYSF